MRKRNFVVIHRQLIQLNVVRQIHRLTAHRELEMLLRNCKWVTAFRCMFNKKQSLTASQQHHVDDELKQTKYHQLLATLGEEERGKLSNMSKQTRYA